MRAPYLDDGDVRLYLGDCIEVMREMEAESVDAVVCDPPYGLEFMGKDWDSFRVDDPGTTRNRGERAGNNGGAGGGDGSHPASSKRASVAYGGGNRPRTWRCVGCGKRDQFRNAHSCAEGTRWAQELVDPFSAPPTMLAFSEWVRQWSLEAYRVLKPGGHLLAFGGTRTFHRLTCGIEDAGFEVRDCLSWLYGSGFPKSLDVSKAIDKAAGAAREWQGWGTALKPAWEPCVVARKPLVGTVAANVQQHGTGALNIDGCRISADGEVIERDEDYSTRTGSHDGYARPGASKFTHKPQQRSGPAQNAGRWPANVAFDEQAAAMLDAQSGERGGGFGVRGASSRIHGGGDGFTDATGEGIGYGDSGGASRFFYTAKASRADRNAGGMADNTHPTVKPTDLMRWLVRLVTPPGGIVLDPFAGSGSTLVAARAEGVRAVGIEREDEYARIIADRLSQLSLFSEAS